MESPQASTFVQARRLFEQRRFMDSLQTLRLDPGQSDAWRGDGEAVQLGAACLDRMGWLEKAGAAFERAAAGTTPAGSVQRRVSLLLQAATCFERSDRPDRSRAVLDRAANLPIPPASCAQRAALQAAGAWQQFVRGADATWVLSELRRAAHLAQEGPDENRSLMAWILGRQALVHRRAGGAQLALECLDEAIQLMAGDPADPLLGALYRHRGVLRASLLDFSSAAEDQLRALQLVRSTGAVVCEADVQRSLGTLYRRLGRLDEARALLELARERYESVGLSVRAGMAASQMGQVLFSQGLADEALKFYEVDLAALEARGDPMGRWSRARAHVLRRIGRCLKLKAGQTTKGGSSRSTRTAVRDRTRATRTLDRAALLAEQGRDPHSAALARVEQGLVAVQGEDWTGAGRCADLARESIAGIGTPETLAAIERLEAAAVGHRDPVRATELLETALVRLQPDVPTLRTVETHLELSRLLERTGNRQDAVEHDRQAYRGALAIGARHHVQALLGRLMEAAPDEVVGGSLDAAGPSNSSRGSSGRPDRGSPGGREQRASLVGVSSVIQELRAKIERAAHRDMPVLITGETGTGKTHVARAIHQGSGRRKGPFLALNIGAINDSLIDSELFGHRSGAFTGATEDRRGAFRTASGGSLLLDELGDLPTACQVKLLTVLEDRLVRPLGEDLPVAVDVRLLFATHRDLRRLAADGLFRQDLLERIRHYEIHVPSVRERAGDIPLLVRHFLSELGGDGQVSPAALELLMIYSWPGNVRELRHSLEAALVDAGPRGVIMPCHLSRLTTELSSSSGPRGGAPPTGERPHAPVDSMVKSEASPGRSVDDRDAFDTIAITLRQSGIPLLEAITERTIRWALTHCGGNVSEAARVLGVHRNTVTRHQRQSGQGATGKSPG